jgi:hypothetical protein
MKISYSKFANILIAAVLLASPFVVGLTASQYDPWADINDDGKIDIYDVAYTAKLFGASGNPEKNVTVVNWPTSHDETVWWNEPLVGSGYLQSDIYNVSGFGHLHILARAQGLSGSEEVTVTIAGIIPNPLGGGWAVYAYEVTLTSTSISTDISMPVPSETFYIQMYAPTGTSVSIYLSFYLTWT